jgi:hypothetical protein
MRVAALLFALTAVASARESDRLTRTLLVVPATPVTIRATVGEITVAGWNRAHVSVEVTRRAPSLSQLAALPVDILESDQTVTIAVLQADGGRDAALAAGLTIWVPANQRLDVVELFEGRISLRDLTGGTRARVEHGSINATSLRGDVRLETVVGDIRLDDAAPVSGDTIRLRAFNGDVAIGLASPLQHARILALSLGGAVDSKVPLTRRTVAGPRFAEATIGRGDALISIDTVRGDIRITGPTAGHAP